MRKLKSTAYGASRFGSQLNFQHKYLLYMRSFVCWSKCLARAWRYMGFYIPCTWFGWRVNM